MSLRVCRADEVGPGEMKGFEVEGLDWPVLVANVDGELFAASSLCPHDDVSLLGGRLAGARVVCPGHAYEFDLATGRCAHEPSLALFRYRISVVDGDLYIRIV